VLDNTGRDDTGAMPETRSQQDWTAQLNSAIDELSNAATMHSVNRTLAMVWRTTAAVMHPASPATEFGWMRLAEALLSARQDLHAVDGELPDLIDPASAPAIDGSLRDTPRLRTAVARLVHAAAVAMRTLPGADDPRRADQTLTLASVAAGLDDAVEDWL
jgi:hypothetical protein